MSLEEKLGQLFMVQVFSSQDKATKTKIVKLIKDQHIGGLIYSKGGPVRQARLNNELQAAAKVPLLIGMDAAGTMAAVGLVTLAAAVGVAGAPVELVRRNSVKCSMVFYHHICI